MTLYSSRAGKSLLRFCGSFFLLYIFLLLNFGLTNWKLLLHLTGVILLQILLGMLIFSFSKVGSELSFLNFTVISFVIGTSTNVVIRSLFPSSSNNTYILMGTLPLLLGVPRLVKRLKSELISSEEFKPDLILVGTSLAIIQLQILSWMRANPISWNGWWKFHIDIGFFESLSNSLDRLGPLGSSMVSGGEIRYHWFAYSLIGQMNSLTTSEPFFVLTRFYPFVLLFISALSMYGFSSIFLKRKSLRILSIIVLLLGPGLSIGSLVPVWSPSSMLSVPYSLGFLVFLSKLLELKRIALPDVVLLFLFSLALMGSKSTTAVVIELSLATLATWLFLIRRKKSFQKLTVYGLSIIFMTLSFFILIWTKSGRSLEVDLFLGWPGVMATSLGLYLGVFLAFSKYKINEELSLYYLIVLLGFILSLVTRDPFGNQLYFFFFALTIATPLSLKWLSELDFNLFQKLVQFRSWPVLIFVGSFVPILVWSKYENQVGILGDLGRTFSPYLLLFFSFGIYKLFMRHYQTIIETSSSRIFLCILLAMTMMSSTLFTFRDYFYGPKYSKLEGVTKIGPAKPLENGAINYDYVIAGKWVNENIPQDELGFTNRQCFDSKSNLKTCDTRWFFASALSKRSFLIEGSAYSAGNAGKMGRLSKNELLSIDFAVNPNMTSLKELSSKGVTWGWIDKNVTELRTWAPFAEVLYENPQIMIIKLNT